MKVVIMLDANGQEALALGREIYPWHLTSRPVDGSYKDVPKGHVVVGETVLTMPAPEAGIANVLENLQDREQELRRQLNEDLMELEERRLKLLAISYIPPAAPVPTLPEDWKDFTHCLKTGCAMIYEDRWYWGDLHEDRNIDGSTFYFNATAEVGESCVNGAVIHGTCHFTVAPDAFVQRVGKVFVISEGSLLYNKAFEKFNAKWNK